MSKPGHKSSARMKRKRESIRSAAYRCFRERGYHETTVDSICEEAGISKGSLYWHYGSKQEVFIDILDAWSHEVMDELYEQFQDALEQPNYIEALTTAFEREARRGRAIVPLWLEFAVHARRDPKIREALSRFHRRSRTAIAEMLRPALRGRTSEEELQGIASAAFGAYTGLLTWEISDPEGQTSPEVFGSVMSVVGRLLQRAGAGEMKAPERERDREESGTAGGGEPGGAGAQIVGALGRLLRRVQSGDHEDEPPKGEKASVGREN